MKYHIQPVDNDSQITAEDRAEIEALFTGGVRQFATYKRGLRHGA